MAAAKKVLVVGAGVGGLALARGLLEQGLDVTLVERAERFSPAGAGVVLAANAVAVLDALGLDVSDVGQPLPGMSITNARGVPLQTAIPSELGEAFHTLYAMHRADLHERLLAGADGAELRMGLTVEALVDDGAGVDARFSDGTSGRFDLVVGADGVRSRVRSLVYGDAAPGTVYSGYTCWRFVTSSEGTPEGAVEMFGRGDRAGIVPLTRGRAYVFLVADAPEGGPSASYPELKERFSRFPAVVTKLLDAAAAEVAPLLHHDLSDAERVVWGEGRVWLLGDAAHAPLPNLGQGAAMALEDALALTRAVSHGDDVDAAFSRYVAQRHERATVIWRNSRRLGWVGQWSGAVSTRLRDALISWAPGALTRRQLESIVRPGVELARASA